jgi:hypothetical protein
MDIRSTAGVADVVLNALYHPMQFKQKLTLDKMTRR